MCGIAGIVDYENERQTMSWDILKAMQDTMRRRGPIKTGSGMIALYRWCMRG